MKIFIDPGKKFTKSFLLYLYLRHQLFSNRRVQWFNILFSQLPCIFENFLKLIDGWSARKQRSPHQNLPDNTTYTPNVNRLPVAPTPQQQFRGPIPLRGNLLWKNHLLPLRSCQTPDQSKITNFCRTFWINQHIGWLQVSMDELGRVHIPHRFKYLIKHINLMNFLKDIRTHNGMQICFHKLEHQIQILLVFGLVNLIQAYDIWVLQLVQDFNFTVGTLSIYRISKCVKNFF